MFSGSLIRRSLFSLNIGIYAKYQEIGYILGKFLLHKFSLNLHLYLELVKEKRRFCQFVYFFILDFVQDYLLKCNFNYINFFSEPTYILLQHKQFKFSYRRFL
jgi:hypothetical protein